MPKKKENLKKDESDLEEESQRDKSELEESLENFELEEIAEEIEEEGEDQIIDDLEFKTFLQPASSIRAPVLDEIVGEQGIQPIFFRTGQRGAIGEEETQLYGATQQNAEDPKYTSMSSIQTDTQQVDFSKIGRGTSPNISEAQLTESFEARRRDNPKYETSFDTKEINIQQAGRQNPFETKFQNKAERKDSEYVVR